MGYIYEDDFAVDTGTWLTGEGADGEALIDDGHLIFKMNASRAFVLSGTAGDFGDFKARITSHPQTDAAGYEYGIIFREEDSDNFYMVSISSDGKYAWRKVAKDQWSTLISWTRSNAVGADENDLWLVCVGNEINLHVNDTLLFARKDSSFAHGGLSLYASTNYAPNAEVWFSYLSCTKPRKMTWSRYLPPLPLPPPRLPRSTPERICCTLTWSRRAKSTARSTVGITP